MEYLPQRWLWGESSGGPNRPYLAVSIRQAAVHKAPLNHTQSAPAPSNSATSKGRRHEGPLCLTFSLGCKMLLSLCPNTYRIVPLASQWEHLFPDTHRALRGRLQGHDGAPCAQCTLVTLRSSFLHAYERVPWLIHKPVLTFDLITHSLEGGRQNHSREIRRRIIWPSLCNSEQSRRQSGPGQTDSWTSGPLLSLSN